MDLFICLAGLVGEQQPWGTLESIGDAVSQVKNYDMLSRREKGYFPCLFVCLGMHPFVSQKDFRQLTKRSAR